MLDHTRRRGRKTEAIVGCSPSFPSCGPPLRAVVCKGVNLPWISAPHGAPMTADQLTAFLRPLQALGLLEAEQWKALNSEPPDRFGDAAGLAKELVRRGWLTHHQANLLYRGRAADLVLGQYLLLDTLGGGG